VTCDIKWLVTDIDFNVTAVIPVKAVCKGVEKLSHSLTHSLTHVLPMINTFVGLALVNNAISWCMCAMPSWWKITTHIY
jgi:hypothetical protein